MSNEECTRSQQQYDSSVSWPLAVALSIHCALVAHKVLSVVARETYQLHCYL
jgi:hypothetical protein